MNNTGISRTSRASSRLINRPIGSLRDEPRDRASHVRVQGRPRRFGKLLIRHHRVGLAQHVFPGFCRAPVQMLQDAMRRVAKIDGGGLARRRGS